MKTKFNFNSQICTNKIQSIRLLALGLKKETADCYYWQETEPMYGEAVGIWHLETLDSKDSQEHFEYLDKNFGVCLADDEEHYFIPSWSLHRLWELLGKIKKYEGRKGLEDGIIDIEKVNKIKKIMPSYDLLFDIAEVFKVFGDTTRMKIISALLEAELCVGDIAEITNSTQSAISHQLRVLKQAKLVKFRKDGKIVYYSLDDEHVSEMYEMAKRHIEESYARK